MCRSTITTNYARDPRKPTSTPTSFFTKTMTLLTFLSPLTVTRPATGPATHPLLQNRKAISHCSIRADAANIPSKPHPLLTDTTAQQHFLKTHWNVRPVLFKNLLPDYQSPVTPDDLAALSADPSLHSRLIAGKTEASTFKTATPYTLQLGPFPSTFWQTLPEVDWTLLVQGLDCRVPALTNLLDNFSFLPNWRVDDIQASYAVQGGGVGPHVDNYDVFLIQAAGTRRWRISNTPIPPTHEHCIPNIDVRVLNDPFEIDGDYVLRPGDALYIPPRFPHWGQSLDDDCITFSVGFRAPALSTLLTGWVENLINAHNLAETFYTDDVANLAENAQDPGHISPSAASRAFDLITKALSTDDTTRHQFATWFATEVSQRKTFQPDDEEVEYPMDVDQLKYAMKRIFTDDQSHPSDTEPLLVRQQQGAVFTYVRETDSDAGTMYIDGHPWLVEHCDIASTLCSKRCLDPTIYKSLAENHPSFIPLVERLFQSDLLYIDDGVDADFDDDFDFADKDDDDETAIVDGGDDGDEDDSAVIFQPL